MSEPVVDLRQLLGGPPPEPEKKTGDLGRDEFLRMLIAQLENQDPLNPADATQFTEQLATFSSLEQLLAIREGIDDLVASNRDREAGTEAAARLRPTDVVGRQVLVPGDTFRVGDAPPPEILFELSEQAARASLVLTRQDGGGTPVELDLAALGLSLGPGRHAVDLAAVLGTAGRELDPGVWRFEVRASVPAAGGAARPVAVTPLVWERVREASLREADPSLRLGAGEVRLSEVLAVREGT